MLAVAALHRSNGLNRVRRETQYPSWPSTSPTLVTQFGSDPVGNRTSLPNPLGRTTSFSYDVNGGLPVLLEDGSRKYVWGLGLAYGVDGAGTVEVYHTDGLGSVRALSDASQTVVARYETDEFGVPTSTTSRQPFGYTGEQRDAATGLVYLRARMYDPSVGRFLQRDPWPGRLRSPLSLNRFAYGLPNPVAFTDPSGFSSSRVTRESSTSEHSDHECLQRGGILWGYGVNARCLELPFLGRVPIPLSVPGGPTIVIPGLAPMAPPHDDGGEDAYEEYEYPIKPDRLRGRSPRRAEQAQIARYTRDMTESEREEFTAEVHRRKHEVGRGGDDNLSTAQLQEIREEILSRRRQE